VADNPEGERDQLSSAEAVVMLDSTPNIGAAT